MLKFVLLRKIFISINKMYSASRYQFSQRERKKGNIEVRGERKERGSIRF